MLTPGLARDNISNSILILDYRGNVCVLMHNLGKEVFHIKSGDRCAQLVLQKILIATVKEERCLDITKRGGGGFGSTNAVLS